jgi:predicted lipoprotein with Yx(FWY)xxD motif
MTRIRAAFLGCIALAAIVLAGCGSAAAAGGTSGTSTSGTSSGGAHISTHSVTIGGKSVTVLATSQGMTLYYFDPDTITSVACSGSCASTWPPLLTSGAPIADSSLPGTLDVIAGANGQQVTYNGHPLYTYKGDSAPGQANGDGINGKWHVATPGMAPNTNGSGSGGYGGGGGY